MARRPPRQLTTSEWAGIWQSLILEYLREGAKAHELLKQAKTPADEVRLSKKARKHVKRMLEIERELGIPPRRRAIQ